jgi:hypothetical protein
MTTYVTIPKASGTPYTVVSSGGKRIYDDPSVIYDDPNCLYDGVNNSYVTIAKAAGTTYVTLPKTTG